MFRKLGAALVLWVGFHGAVLADPLYTVEELLPLPGYSVSHAYAVNDSGQVVGYSYQEGATQFKDVTPNVTEATLWDQGTAVSVGSPEDTNNFYATDINNSGQIVGVAGACFGFCPEPFTDQYAALWAIGTGGYATVAPDSSAPVPAYDFRPDCALDDMFSAISDSGHILSGINTGGIASPNIGTQLCGLDPLAFYESGLVLTDIGYVYDPLVDGTRQWVVVPTCTGDLTGYVIFGSPNQPTPSVPSAIEVSDQVAQSICDLASGELHIKTTNASGQFILNVGDRAFLYTPCSEFPGGGSTEGCFPGPGAFPGKLPEPGTLALIGIGLAGLALGRRKRAA